VCRFVPVVRHLISIPAGVGGMNLIKFCVYTLIGGTIWNTILLVAGIKLKERWEIIHEYSSQLDKVVVVILVIVGVWWIRHQLRRLRQKAAQ
jgi:membrane protein DedA with SNARE-associated domain